MKHFLYSTLVALGLCAAGNASAQTFTKLYDFGGATDGGLVSAGLVADANGILYGVTSAGGNNSFGSVFKFNPTQPGSGITILHSFGGSSQVAGPAGNQTDGVGPEAGLVLSGSTLYGTTRTGGSTRTIEPPAAGMGTIFKINTDGNGYQVLKNFTGTDGDYPSATLIHSGGVLYGTTVSGGTSGKGTVFKINADGTGYVVLKSFTGFTDDMTANDDGEGPKGALWLEGNTLYGTTGGGGNNQSGTVFKVNTDQSGYAIIQHFDVNTPANTTGALPNGGLVLSGGMLYGTASTGGSGGAGTIFKVGTAVDSTITPIKSFVGGTGGGMPLAPLIMNDSLFYGTAHTGGAGEGGMVFQIDSTGAFAALKSFTAPDPFTGEAPDGASPAAPVVLSGTTLYGTTLFGGGPDGIGTIFSLTIPVASPAPAITSVTGPSAGSYKAGQTLSFTVNFSASVTVTGTPRIPLTIGSTTRYASYASGSGSMALTFTYTVQAGETDTDGIAVTSPIDLNSGTITATTGGTAATLTFTPPATTPVKVDTTAPTVSSVAITSATGIQNSFLNEGDIVNVTVTMSEPTTVNITGGTPGVALNIGGTGVQAGYVSGSGSPTLVFQYTILAGQNDADGIAIPVNATKLNGGTLTDAAGNAATPTSALIPFSAGYKVDTTTPGIISFTRQDPTAVITSADTLIFRATFTEDVQNVSTADFAVNGTTTATVTGVNAVSASIYDVTVFGGNLAGFNGSVGLNLAGSPSVQDLAGNALPTGEPATDETYSIDNTAPTISISAPSASSTATGPITYTVTYADANFSTSTLANNDVTLNKTGTANGTVSVSGSGNTRTVTIGSITGSGTLGISIVAGTASDLAGNTASAAGPSTTFTVLSSNADLSALTLSTGTLSPTFASGTVSYTATVPNATASITVTPTKADANASIQVRVNGGSYTAVTSGNASGSLTLNVGANTVEVKVTAQDGTTTKTYTVTVTRPSNNANLSNLTMSPGTLSPVFASGTVYYTATVPNTTSSITFTPTAAEPNATIQIRVNGGTYAPVTSGSGSAIPLVVGGNFVEILVTAQDGTTTKSYGGIFTREGSNANLSALTLSVGSLSPTFDKEETSYTASVPNVTSSLTVTPTSADANATIKVNSVTVPSGTASSIQLNVGVNTISVVVTAQDGTTTKTYTVTVTRLGPPNTAPSFMLGKGWTARKTDLNDTGKKWSAVASSADGTKLVAVVNGGQIYTSTDSGVTWTARESSRNWSAVASSADGTKLVAVDEGVYLGDRSGGGQIYTSTDSGVTWTARESNRNWRSVASSADGTRLAAVAVGGFIYTSVDSGKSWQPRKTDKARGWWSIASSADGTKLVAGSGWSSFAENIRPDLHIFTTTDSGQNWNGHSASTRDIPLGWNHLASSANGTKLVAVEAGWNIFGSQLGRIYTSSDSGATWTQRAIENYWHSVASSEDGNKLVAIVPRVFTVNFFGQGNRLSSHGSMYTSPDAGVTWVEQYAAFNHDWRGIASSADGTKLVAVERDGHIYTSELSPIQQNVANGAGPQSVPNIAQNISPGPASESSQTVSFIVTVPTDKQSLFSVQPAISSSGKLTYTPAVGQSGTATVTVQAKDDGTGTSGGSDTSAAQDFTITVFPSENYSSSGPVSSSLTDKTLANTSGSAITLSGAATLSGGLVIARGPITFSGAVTINNNTILNVTSGERVTFKNLVASPVGSSLVKTGPGRLVIDGANFNGTLTVLEGTVEILNSNNDTCLTLGGNAVAQKNGSIKCVISKRGSITQPGASPGSLTVTGDATWEGGSIYDWEINNATGTAGTDPGWDTINIGGTLTLTGTPTQPGDPFNGPIIIGLTSLDLANAAGPMANFNQTTAYSWRIASAAGGIIGFNPAAIRLDTTGIANSLGGGSFTISKPNATDLVLNFIPAAQLAAPTDIMLLGTTVAEANNFGATIGQFSATDANTSDNHTYTLVSGSGDTDNASFSIAGNTLQAAAVFDYEVKNSYSIRVRVTDAGGLFTEKQFTITVTDVTETATFQPGQIAFVDGKIQLKLQSSGNLLWRIEASSDLSTWTTITESTPGLDGILNFVDPDSGSTPRRFYRAVLVTPPAP